MDEWIVGRKSIMIALRCDAWTTVWRWKKKYGLKFARWPNGQPAIKKTVLDKWVTRFRRAEQTANNLQSSKGLKSMRKLET